MNCSPPGSSVHGISQARILESVAISFFEGSSRPRGQTHISCLAGGFLTTEPPGKSRSYGNSIFNFLRNFLTVFHTFTFSPAKHKSSNFSIPLSTLAIFWHFNNSLDVKRYLMTLVCISLTTSDAEHLLMCLLPSIYPLWFLFVPLKSFPYF